MTTLLNQDEAINYLRETTEDWVLVCKQTGGWLDSGVEGKMLSPQSIFTILYVDSMLHATFPLPVDQTVDIRWVVLHVPAATQAVKGETGAETIEARESVYGPFSVHAEAEQAMKAAMTSQPGWAKLNNVQKSAMEMIVHKMARVLNNSADYDDNWHDIAGYATLAENDAKSRKSTR